MIEDLATKIDIKEVSMNKTISVDDKHSKTFPILVLETWAVATKSQRDTQEMEGGNMGKDQDGVHNKEAEQSS